MSELLKVEDYIIICLILIMSAGAGLYYSVVERKQSSTIEYFLASRNMQIVPVALSYFATIIATGTMIGLPVEIYLYGMQMMLGLLLYPLAIMFNNHFCLPVFHTMKSASIFKYFEVRFNRGVANVAAVASVLTMICHSSVCLYGAAIAVNHVTALNWWMLSGILAAFCIMYSTMGGIRGIIIADAFQALIMLLSLGCLIVIGIIQSREQANFWELNVQTGRFNFFNFNMDPRTRHTFWSSTLGNGMTILAVSCTSQSFLHRLLAAPSIAQAQKANYVGGSIALIFQLVSASVGLLIFAYYNGCNIMTIGLIENPNQLVPNYAMSIFSGAYPCVSGLFFGGIISSSLSTISSALNSIAAVVVESFVKPKLQNMPKKLSTLMCKIIVLITGIVIFFGIIIVDKYPNVLQASVVTFSLLSTPLFVLLMIGIFCPQANTKLATYSFIFSIVFGIWIAAGNLVLKTQYESKPFYDDNCPAIIDYTQRPINMTNSDNFTLIQLNQPMFATEADQLTSLNIDSNTTTMSTTEADQLTSLTISNITTMSTTSNSILFYIFPLSSVSYQWYSLIGTITCLTSFILLTLIFAKNTSIKTLDDSHKDLIPDTVKRIHMKFSRKTRQIFLCDVYN